ncbi:MAG TPA: nucleotidyltransferase domain-containing protein [Gemmatimonadales bacterium]|nr:nucleotidyltransferase domain-containing protein [Gemmatimonadales bacterium]
MAHLKRKAREVCAADPNITAVILFGSFITGGATPSSDVDLLVVLREDARRVLDRVPDYAQRFEGLGVAVQVFPWTEAEIRARLAAEDAFAADIVRTGTRLAGTWQPETPVRRRMRASRASRSMRLPRPPE